MGDLRPGAMLRADRGQRIEQAKPLVAPASCRTPPSNAAVTFFRQTLGSENGRRLSSATVGMANSVQASGVASVTNLYAISGVCTMPFCESLLCSE
jgi:hypothetical protein